jgi:hypothetical protein
MRTCTAHYVAFMPAAPAGISTWFEGRVRLSASTLIDNQPSGY